MSPRPSLAKGHKHYEADTRACHASSQSATGSQQLCMTSGSEDVPLTTSKHALITSQATSLTDEIIVGIPSEKVKVSSNDRVI
jgi:hypothetical protein